MLGRSIDKIVKEYLVGWLQWVGHNGTQASGIKKKVFVQKRGPESSRPLPWSPSHESYRITGPVAGGGL